MMSSGTCRAVFDGGDSCSRPTGHPGDHFGTVDRQREEVPAELCGNVNPSGDTSCAKLLGHFGDHYSQDLGVTWSRVRVPEPLHSGTAEPAIPDSVRTRVRLHAAQTEYDLTVLKNRLDCMPTVTNVSKELRLKREQLTAELEAWTYLAKITRRD